MLVARKALTARLGRGQTILQLPRRVRVEDLLHRTEGPVAFRGDPGTDVRRVRATVTRCCPGDRDAVPLDAKILPASNSGLMAGRRKWQR
jgi:hypothetical protein